MRPGVIVSVGEFAEGRRTEEGDRSVLRKEPMERLCYCIEELDKELLSLSSPSSCEAILTARHEISTLKSLISHILPSDQPPPLPDKPENYQRVIQELHEERERLEMEITQLDAKEKEIKMGKVVGGSRRVRGSPVAKDWESEFDEY